MKIKIMGRHEAISYSYHKNIDNCIIISISGIDQNPPNFDRTNLKIKGVLKLFFDDIEDSNEKGVLMSKDDGFKIKEFVEDFKDKIDTIIVHCQAGVSRSAGVATSIDMWLNGDDMDIWSSGIYYPNKHCYKVMLEVLGFEFDEEKFEIKRKVALEKYYERLEEDK